MNRNKDSCMKSQTHREHGTVDMLPRTALPVLCFRNDRAISIVSIEHKMTTIHRTTTAQNIKCTAKPQHSVVQTYSKRILWNIMTGILHKRPDVVTIMTIQMPNKKEGNRIIRIIRARIQDPRSKIAQRFCAGNLGSNAQPNHPSHFRIILIRARPWIQDPRSKIAQGSCQRILDPTGERRI